jgi:acyl-CoA thioester hydrolase
MQNEFKQYPVIHQQDVAWGDMDAFGHVNNVMYHRYVESTRIKYFDVLQLLKNNVLTVVSSNQCKYLKPVFYPDRLHIACRIEEMRNTSFRMHYLLWSEQQNCLVAEAEAVVVFVEAESLKKTQIPNVIRQQIIDLEKTVQHDLK